MYEIPRGIFAPSKQSYYFPHQFWSAVITWKKQISRIAGELYLVHTHEELIVSIREIQPEHFQDLEAFGSSRNKINDRGKLFTFDGKDHIELGIGAHKQSSGFPNPSNASFLKGGENPNEDFSLSGLFLLSKQRLHGASTPALAGVIVTVAL
jgi:hypothetical protein